MNDELPYQESIHPDQKQRDESHKDPRETKRALVENYVLIKIGGIGKMPINSTLLPSALQNTQSGIGHGTLQ